MYMEQFLGNVGIEPDNGSSASAHSVMRVENGQYRDYVVQSPKARATELADGGSVTVHRMGVSADHHLHQQQQPQQWQHRGTGNDRDAKGQ